MANASRAASPITRSALTSRVRNRRSAPPAIAAERQFDQVTGRDDVREILIRAAGVGLDAAGVGRDRLRERLDRRRVLPPRLEDDALAQVDEIGAPDGRGGRGDGLDRRAAGAGGAAIRTGGRAVGGVGGGSGGGGSSTFGGTTGARTTALEATRYVEALDAGTAVTIARWTIGLSPVSDLPRMPRNAISSPLSPAGTSRHPYYNL